jgi:hypothetical protein
MKMEVLQQALDRFPCAGVVSSPVHEKPGARTAVPQRGA